MSKTNGFNHQEKRKDDIVRKEPSPHPWTHTEERDPSHPGYFFFSLPNARLLPSVNSKANDSEMLFTIRLSLPRWRTLFKKHYSLYHRTRTEREQANAGTDGRMDGQLINGFHLTM
jgi:hypothetical protein